jgi:hypothetical protein
MTILGGLTIAPAVVLPAYFEYRVAQAKLANQQATLAEVRATQDAVERQIQYFHHDPAYVERMWRYELGMTPPDVATETIDLPESPAVAAAPRTEVQQPYALLSEYPLLRLFVIKGTRTLLLIFGAVMILSAILLCPLRSANDQPQTAKVNS